MTPFEIACAIIAVPALPGLLAMEVAHRRDRRRARSGR